VISLSAASDAALIGAASLRVTLLAAGGRPGGEAMFPPVSVTPECMEVFGTFISFIVFPLVKILDNPVNCEG